MTLFTPVKATVPTTTARERPSRGLPSNLMNFCTPSKPNHFEDSDDDDYPNTAIKHRSNKQGMATPATVNESPLSSAESVSSSPNLMSISSQDDSLVSAAGIPKRLGFDKPTQISFDEKSDSSSSRANYLVLAFALILLRLIWLESSSVKANIRLSPGITRFESFEDYQQASVRQFEMPETEGMDQLPNINDLKFYKLEQDESGTFLRSIEGKELLGPPRPFSRRWMKQKGTQIKETRAFLKEKSVVLKEKSESGISEVLQEDHILI
ncbi:unnamed protein product [Cylindrotheca closterium]|uniref:Uncharacterized protein n=1 Tax=Cylindrotheca closterium TaxID=2856 RepID=A0AAD2JHC4_9STRA|nr:unnamed protein product [Cylindrotheca closterium]